MMRTMISTTQNPVLTKPPVLMVNGSRDAVAVDADGDAGEEMAVEIQLHPLKPLLSDCGRKRFVDDSQANV